jgi:hypothetical protein
LRRVTFRFFGGARFACVFVFFVFVFVATRGILPPQREKSCAHVLLRELFEQNVSTLMARKMRNHFTFSVRVTFA